MARPYATLIPDSPLDPDSPPDARFGRHLAALACVGYHPIGARSSSATTAPNWARRLGHSYDLHTSVITSGGESGQDEGPVAVVAHSLGGLITHRAMEMAPEAKISHRIFVATPHRGSAFARRGRESPVSRLLSPAARTASHGYPMPESPALTGVVMGTKDRLVSPAEADLKEAHARLELPFGHNELLMRPNLAHAVHRFVTKGYFEEPLPKFRP